MNLEQEFISSQSSDTLLEACCRAVDRYISEDPRGDRPTDLHGTARRNNIHIEYLDGYEREGSFERDAFGRPTITIRRETSLRRQRFTLAHELGHFILQEELPQLSNARKNRLFRGLSTTSSEVAVEERLANLLAAEILMPYRRIGESAEALLRTPLQSIKRICRALQVSRIAALRRVADVLGLNAVYLEVIPIRFAHLDSIARVDDAIYITSNRTTLYARERTELMHAIPFDRFIEGGVLDLRISGPNGSLHGTFETDYSPRPEPHAYALHIQEEESSSTQSTCVERTTGPVTYCP